MSLFDERERAFEAKWAHDEEMQFRILVKRNELLGRWAAAELGLAGTVQEAYVANLIAMVLKRSDTAELFEKLRADLGAAHSSSVILAKMDDFLQAASLDAGLVQGRPLAEGTAHPHPAGQRGHADFGQILTHAEAVSIDRSGAIHARVGRAATAHRSKRSRGPF